MTMPLPSSIASWIQSMSWVSLLAGGQAIEIGSVEDVDRLAHGWLLPFPRSLGGGTRRGNAVSRAAI